jgi:hypothetical protein
VWNVGAFFLAKWAGKGRRKGMEWVLTTLAELGSVFEMIAAEYDERGLLLPADSTAIVNAERPR